MEKYQDEGYGDGVSNQDENYLLSDMPHGRQVSGELLVAPWQKWWLV
jgi:hypothetical protein